MYLLNTHNHKSYKHISLLCMYKETYPTKINIKIIRYEIFKMYFNIIMLHETSKGTFDHLLKKKKFNRN